MSYRAYARYLCVDLEIPRHFTFSEVAYARHNSSKLDSALTYSQHRLCRDDKLL